MGALPATVSGAMYKAPVEIKAPPRCMKAPLPPVAVVVVFVDGAPCDTTCDATCNSSSDAASDVISGEIRSATCNHARGNGRHTRWNASCNNAVHNQMFGGRIDRIGG